MQAANNRVHSLSVIFCYPISTIRYPLFAHADTISKIHYLRIFQKDFFKKKKLINFNSAMMTCGQFFRFKNLKQKATIT
jgi:hypothetical protein